jgi:trimethylamine:corrinoid methyltransferase-like protein
MQKYDKSLVEVWEWKEKVYQKVKDLSTQEYIEKVRKDTDRILSEHGIKLRQHRKRDTVKTNDNTNT